MTRRPQSGKSASGKKNSAVKKPTFTAAPSDFVDNFYADLLPSDLALFSVSERERMAASIWALVHERHVGETKIHVFNPSPETDGWIVDHTVIEIVTDDMPFLVGSLTSVLQHAGYAVHLVIHPVLEIVRDNKGRAQGLGKAGKPGVVAESITHIQIDHCLDPAQLTGIESDIRTTLADVRAAVDDWQKMRERMHQASDAIDVSVAKSAAGEDIEEIRAFLRWLCDNNFTFLGYREIALDQKDNNVTAIRVLKERGLGILRDDDRRMFGGLRDLDEKRRPALRKYVRQHHVLFITKTNTIARVHRAVPMDAVFIRSFNDKGTVISERLFVGLFTSKTYAQTPFHIPFMRRKIADVQTRMGYPPKSHDGRTLMHILNTYPHDELFQITEDELYTNVRGILQLQERARVALFPRRDPFGRYVTCLIYVPRDRYDSALRRRIQDFLENAYGGKAQSWNVRIDDSRLARAFVTIHLTPDSPNPDAQKLESDLREMCRTWSDRLRDSLVGAHGEATALTLLRRYADVFPETYREAISPARAVYDIRELERMRIKPSFVATLSEKNGGYVRLKLLQPDRPLKLSEILPLLENMGLKIDYMGGPYEIKFKDGSSTVYIHKFVGTPALPALEPFERYKTVFEDTLIKVWSGEIENDPFNALALRIGLDGRAIVLLRSFARYLRQLRIPYSHDMMASALLAHPQIARQIYALFYARHNPALKGDRSKQLREIEAGILDALTKVQALEEDRIIRRYLNLVQASLRTNFFQTDASGIEKNYLSIKFDSRAVEFMPLPKPLYEIFVYSPQTEAVHLRGGKVARGGIRWSDRRDDFRAEILGLMKAQMVKNTVIVPVGSKGGFIVKRPPADADAFLAEGIACYKVMIRGLLDITDNRKNGSIIPPAHVVRHDGDDPYLVVAADKGTAKFSDIANMLSQEYGFWLDDAFASGGSAGYDHKGMGITARGAWEAVKRHFRELGKDVQKEDFTCIGVGDMSGDVFGNGMVLSSHILLMGAFDHRHIFCDPMPDAATSLAERQRLFALPRSSWDNYDRKLISKGGGIFARNEKTLRITPEMKKAYGITADTLAPADLIQAMLKAEVELIYFGGIGTYVKATDETHEEVGDRANESLRVNGNEIRAKLIGEGANLGMTQRGRIEYALNGGRLNTDAIDNSAGVDTSDHEVNIKVLLRRAVDRKKLTIPARNKLLASMTDDVAELVLRDNYLQTQALSVAEAQAVDLLPAHVRSIQILEKSGLLNRAVEFLPDDADIAERQRSGKGLMRPELAVLLAYAKIWLYQKILDSTLPDDAALVADVAHYFPKALSKNYADDIEHHQLRREIAATIITNDLVNHTGMHAALTLSENAGVDPASIARAYWLVRHALGLPHLWDEIDALDGRVHANVQTKMLLTINAAVGEAIKRVLTDKTILGHLSVSIDATHHGLTQLSDWMTRHTAALGTQFHHTITAWCEQGVPEVLARRVAYFPTLVSAYDLLGLSAKTKLPVGDLAAIFFRIDKRLDLGWLSRLPQGVKPWEREAMQAALDELTEHHRRLTSKFAAKQKKNGPDIMQEWASRHAQTLERYDALLTAGHAVGTPDLAMVLLANQLMDTLAS